MAKTGVIVIIAVIVILGVVAFLLFNNSSNQDTSINQPNTDIPSNSKSIEISSFVFAPQTLSIKAGETITWTNKDAAPHTVTSDSGSELASPTISQGQSYSHTFNLAGEYSYHCAFHPGMKAKVIVSN